MADGDAMGAQFALKTWIMERYPDKSVYAPTASEPVRRIIQVDEVTDTVIARSLAIVLDTATSARVDSRWQLPQRPCASIIICWSNASVMRDRGRAGSGDCEISHGCSPPRRGPQQNVCAVSVQRTDQ
ncbi:MAG: hypothetical protein ACLVJ6_00115 [Merdibacter sp.]